MVPDPSGKAIAASSDELLKECDAVEADLAALRARYEQFFMGLERRPPTVSHKNFKRRLALLKPVFARSAVVKLRIFNLQQRLETFERLWTRTIAEIEAGTYRRDVFKARLHAKMRAALPERAGPTERKESHTAARAAPASRPDDFLGDDNLRQVFDSFKAAKEACREDVSQLSFESLASTLRQQAPAILAKHQAASVQFKVAVIEGKAVLKAIPQKPAK
jgi:hypothetical protein